MRILALLAFSLTLALSSCSNFEKDELYGTWKDETWLFTFNEDNTCEIYNNGNKVPGDCTYSILGNAVEFVSDGKVFMSNVTIKGIENDVLTMELRPMVEAEIHKLQRVEEPATAE